MCVCVAVACVGSGCVLLMSLVLCLCPWNVAFCLLENNGAASRRPAIHDMAQSCNHCNKNNYVIVVKCRAIVGRRCRPTTTIFWGGNAFPISLLKSSAVVSVPEKVTILQFSVYYKNVTYYNIKTKHKTCKNYGRFCLTPLSSRHLHFFFSTATLGEY